VKKYVNILLPSEISSAIKIKGKNVKYRSRHNYRYALRYRYCNIKIYCKYPARVINRYRGTGTAQKKYMKGKPEKLPVITGTYRFRKYAPPPCSVRKPSSDAMQKKGVRDISHDTRHCIREISQAVGSLKKGWNAAGDAQ
jgi:hypothetical protein